MQRTPRLLIAGLLALGLLAPGCGEDDEQEAAKRKAPAAAPSGETDGAPDKGRGPRATKRPRGPDRVDDPHAGGQEDWSRRAAKGCKQTADQYAEGARSGGGDAAALDEYQDKVKDLCDEVGEAISTGDDERLERVSKEICLAATEPFRGPPRDEAVAQCERASRRP